MGMKKNIFFIVSLFSAFVFGQDTIVEQKTEIKAEPKEDLFKNSLGELKICRNRSGQMLLSWK